MPGAVPHTSTIALASTTIKYGLLIADYGVEKAIEIEPGLKEWYQNANSYLNGVIFRKRANKVLKEYLMKGYVINNNRTLVKRKWGIILKRNQGKMWTIIPDKTSRIFYLFLLTAY